MTVLHYQLTASSLTDGKEGLTDAWTEFNGANKLVSDWRNCLSQDVTEIEVFLQWINPLRFAYQKFAPAVQSGGVAQPSLPPNVAFAVERRTDAVGRGERGVLHMPGVPVTFEAQSFLSINGRTAYGLFASECTTDMVLVNSGGLLKPVLYRRAEPLNSPVITDWDIKSWSRVMRRRTVGVGS
jgi:hypothetical protein